MKVQARVFVTILQPFYEVADYKVSSESGEGVTFILCVFYSTFAYAAQTE